MKYWLTVLGIFAIFSFSAQVNPLDLTYEYANGNRYIVHTAQAGNTLWGLHTTYDVPVDDIVKANPGIEKGLKEGFRYMIPAGKAEAGIPNGSQMRLHHVVKGETLFGIAKKYNTTTENLQKYNPELSAGLKVGQQLKIVSLAGNGPVAPVVKEPETKPLTTPSITFSDTLLNYTVKESETLYSVSKRFMVPVNTLQEVNGLKSTKIKPGDVLKIPLKKENVKQVPIREVKPLKEDKKIDQELIFKSKESYQVVALLSFDLDKNSNKALQNLATEFYMGLQLAADSLDQLGLKANVKVIDLPIDSAGIYKILASADLKNADLVFGPLVPQSADIVGRWCGKNRIPMICPSQCNTSLLKNNPFVTAAVSTDITQQKVLARYVVENYKNAQIILVNPGPKDKELYDAFRTHFIQVSKQGANIKLVEAKTTDFTTFIRKGGENVIVYPTTDRGSVMKFVDQLHKVIGKSTNTVVTVMGTKEWGNFDDVNGYYKNKYNFTWASSSDLNYTLEPTKQLGMLYRKKYNADLGKAGAHGFDIFYYFCSTFLMGNQPKEQVINAFEIKQVESGSGKENKSCFILKHVDYQISRMGIFYE